jgi:hypothetical protein
MRSGMDKIERLRAMAHEALVEYQSGVGAGSEPAYPQWADDILDICEQAEAGLQFLYTQNTPSKTTRHLQG